MSLIKAHVILLKDYNLLKPINCVGIHLASTVLQLRCSRIIFSPGMTLGRSSAPVIYLEEELDGISCNCCTRHGHASVASPTDWLTAVTKHYSRDTGRHPETQSSLHTAVAAYLNHEFHHWRQLHKLTRNWISIRCSWSNLFCHWDFGKQWFYDVMIKTPGVWRTWPTFLLSPTLCLECDNGS